MRSIKPRGQEACTFVLRSCLHWVLVLGSFFAGSDFVLVSRSCIEAEETQAALEPVSGAVLIVASVDFVKNDFFTQPGGEYTDNALFIRNALQRLTGTGGVGQVGKLKPVIAFFGARKPPEERPDPSKPVVAAAPSDYAAVTEYLAKSFDVRSISLRKGDALDDLVSILKEENRRRDEVGEDPNAGQGRGTTDPKAAPSGPKDLELIKALIVAQPHQLEPRQVYEINRAVSLGVPAIFLVSHYSMDISRSGVQGGIPVATLSSGLEDVFRKWGVDLGSEVLASNNCGTVRLPRMIRGGLVDMKEQPLPVCVKASAATLDQSHPLTNRIRHLIFPASPGLKILRDAIEKNGLAAEILARSARESWSVKVDPFERLQNPRTKSQGVGWSIALYQEDLARLKSPEDVKEFRDFIGPVPLALLLRGKFPFAFEGTRPEWKKE